MQNVWDVFGSVDFVQHGEAAGVVVDWNRRLARRWVWEEVGPAKGGLGEASEYGGVYAGLSGG